MFRPRMMMRSFSRPVMNSSPAVDVTQVAGAEERPLAAVGQDRLQQLPRFLRPVPVTGGDTRGGDPDLADLPRAAAAAGLRVNEFNPHAIGDAPTADQPPCIVGFVRACRSPRVSLQAAGRHPGPNRVALDRAAGDEKGGLGEAVAGEESPQPEPAAGEGRREAVQRLGADRSAPLKATCRLLRSSPSFCASVTRFRQCSQPKFGPPLVVARYSATARSHRIGSWRKAAGDRRVVGKPT